MRAYWLFSQRQYCGRLGARHAVELTAPSDALDNSRRPAMFQKAALVLASATLLCASALGQATDTKNSSDAQRLQRQGIARIDHFLEQARRTGELTSASQQIELDKAEQDLTRSLQISTAAADHVSVASTLIALGDIQRLQNHWDPALILYNRALAVAEMAQDVGSRAKAVTNVSRVEVRRGDLEGALNSANLAVLLGMRADSKTLLVDALITKAEVESARGDQASALQSIGRAISEATTLKDQIQLMFAHIDRADFLITRSNRCDYEPALDACFRDLDEAAAEYGTAIPLAAGLGYDWLVSQLKSFVAEVAMRRTLIKKNPGFLAHIPTGLRVALDAKEANVGTPVSVTVSITNGKNEVVAPNQEIVVTLESDFLAAPIRMTIPAGRTSTRAQVTFNRPGVARVKASATNLEAGYAAIAVKRLTTAKPGFGLRPALALSDPIPQLAIEILPEHVMPRQGVWSASVFVTSLDQRGEPVDVADDLPIRLAATLGNVTPALIVIKKGTSTCAEEISVTSTTAGTDRVYGYSPRFARGVEKQIQYERSRPSRLLVHAAPGVVANTGRTPIEIMVILQDDHHNPATFDDRVLPVVLTSTLGTLSPHEATVLKGTAAAGPFRLTSARSGSALVTARAEGLPDGSAAVSFEFPWLLVLFAMLGGVGGAALRSQIARQRHVWLNLAIGGLMGLILFGLTLLGVTGLIPSVPLPAIENLSLNEFGAFLLGLFGGYLGRRFLDKFLTPVRSKLPARAVGSP
jgi:tetratricopeptide (TPR) repeat protein